MGIIKSIAISAITALGFNLYSGSSPAQNYLPGTLPDGSQPLNLEERISNKDILDVVKKGDKYIVKLTTDEIIVDSKKYPNVNKTYTSSDVAVYLWDRDQENIGDKLGPLKSGDFVSDSMGSGNWYGIAVIDKTKSGVGHPVKVGEELHRTERLKSLVDSISESAKLKSAPEPTKRKPTPVNNRSATPLRSTPKPTPKPAHKLKTPKVVYPTPTARQVELYGKIIGDNKVPLTGKDDGFNLLFMTREGKIMTPLYLKGYENDICTVGILKPGEYLLTTNDPGEKIVMRGTSALYSETLDGKLSGDNSAIRFLEANENDLALEFRKPGVHYLIVRVKNKLGGEETDILEVIVPDSAILKHDDKQKAGKRKKDGKKTGIVAGANVSYALLRKDVIGRDLRFEGEEPEAELFLGYALDPHTLGLYADVFKRSLDILASQEGKFRPGGHTASNIGYRVGLFDVLSAGKERRELRLRSTLGFVRDKQNIEFNGIDFRQNYQGADGSLRFELPGTLHYGDQTSIGLYGDVAAQLVSVEQVIADGGTINRFNRQIDLQAETGLTADINKADLTLFTGFGYDSRYQLVLKGFLDTEELQKTSASRVRDLTYATAPNAHGNYVTGGVGYSGLGSANISIKGTTTVPSVLNPNSAVSRNEIELNVTVGGFLFSLAHDEETIAGPRMTRTDKRNTVKAGFNYGILDDINSWAARRFRLVR